MTEGNETRVLGSVSWRDAESIAEEIRDYLAEWMMRGWQEGVAWANEDISGDTYQRLAAHGLAEIAEKLGATERLIEVLMEKCLLTGSRSTEHRNGD